MTNGITDFDLTQTIMALNLAANRATGAFGSTASVTQFLTYAVGNGGTWTGVYGDLNNPSATMQVYGLLETIGGQLYHHDWRIVWGPCVYEVDEICLDNGMFVAYSPSLDMYVVSIAATDKNSLFDWFVEDFDILPWEMVDAPINLSKNIKDQYVWPSLTKPQFTAGTALGIDILCTRLSDRVNGGLLDFLTKVVKPSATTNLVFTGHSLAGALSPALAYQLRDDLLAAHWNANNILVIATAGPTPGNVAFVADWQNKFRAVDAATKGTVSANNVIKTFNKLYWNLRDLVPHAWTQFTGTPPSGYFVYDTAHPSTLSTPVGPLTGEAKWCSDTYDTFKAAQNMATLVDHLQQLPQISFVSHWPVFNWSSATQNWVPYSPPASLTFDSWGAAVGNAHTSAYFQLVGLTGKEIPVPVP